MSEKAVNKVEATKEIATIVKEDAMIKLIDVLDKNADKVANVVSIMTDKMTEFVAANGQSALDILLLGARVDALNEVFDFLPWAVLAICILIARNKYIKHIDTSIGYIKESVEKGTYTENDITANKEIKGLEDWKFVWRVCGVSGMLFFSLIAALQFFNIWALMGVYDPRIWIAKKILEKGGLM